jgi:predicted nucleotidyltransferase
MTDLKPTVTLSDIQQVARQIVERFRPQKVILFGSYAGGKATGHSDVDLLVVMETDELPLHTAARISASVDHPFPLDILVRKPAELDAYLAEKSIFETEIVTRGMTLYEAKNERVD